MPEAMKPKTGRTSYSNVLMAKTLRRLIIVANLKFVSHIIGMGPALDANLTFFVSCVSSIEMEPWFILTPRLKLMMRMIKSNLKKRRMDVVETRVE